MFKGYKFDADKAKKILADVPLQNAFFFYTDIGAPTGKSASNLIQFCENLKNIDNKSLEFHIKKGDFENWIKFLGDDILAEQIAQLRKKQLVGETLKSRLYATVKERCDELRAASR